jgi:glycosyltransferase involved in cell wall biosynthesis
MEKPVICFQNDKAALLGERRRELFPIDDNDLPFYFCYTEAEVFSVLNSLSGQGISLSSSNLDLLDDFIPHRDGGNCRRTVSAILHHSIYSKSNTEVVVSQSHARPCAIFPSQEYVSGYDKESSIALITSNSELLPENCRLLSPHSWRKELIDENFDVLLVEPYVMADSDWGSVFFSIEETRQILKDVLEVSKSLEISTILSIPPMLTFREYLEDLSPLFSQTLPTLQLPYRENDYDISIIIPTYNGENYLSRSIDSALNQQFAGSIQIVIVDDGSNDRTPDIIRKYCDEHSNIFSITQRNSRQGVARNQGLLAASGEFVSFLDSDDVLPHNAMAELFGTLNRHDTNISVGIVSSCQDGGLNQRVNQSYYHYSKAPSVINSEQWPHLFYDPSCVGKLFNRSFLLSNNLFFPQSFHEDQVFCFKILSLNERIAVTNKVIYFYVAREQKHVPSGTQIFSPRKLRQILLAGTLASDIVRSSTLDSGVQDYALGFLLLRYDRFIWKRSTGPTSDESNLEFFAEFGTLQQFVQPIGDEIIVKNTRYFPLLFLMVKRGESGIATEVYEGKTTSAIQYLEKDLNFSRDLLEKLCQIDHWEGAYNYYRSVPISSMYDDLVTEMSYGYRLGAIFVEAFKSPGGVFKIPFQITLLVFDLATGTGRKKQDDSMQRLLENSPQALGHHSDFVKSTAAYKLGVALMEAFTQGPSKLIKLPAKIRHIYRTTAPG